MTIEQMAAFEQLEHQLRDVVADHDDIEFVTEALLMTAYNLNKSCEIINKILLQWVAAEFPALSVMLKFGVIEKFIDEDGEERIRPKNERAIAYMQASVAHLWDSDAGRAIKAAAAAQLREKKPRS